MELLISVLEWWQNPEDDVLFYELRLLELAYGAYGGRSLYGFGLVYRHEHFMDSLLPNDHV